MTNPNVMLDGVVSSADTQSSQSRKDGERAERLRAQAEERNRKIMEKLERTELEHPTASFKYAIIGDQQKVDELAESIKDGNLTAYLDIIQKVNNYGADIHPMIDPNNPASMETTKQAGWTPKDWDKYYRDLAVQRGHQIPAEQQQEAINFFRQAYHITPEDKFTDIDVLRTDTVYSKKVEYKTTRRVIDVLRPTLCDQTEVLLKTARTARLEDPFIIQEESVKEKWRKAMEGPEGILANNFVFDQNDSSIPKSVSANSQEAPLIFTGVWKD